ncbi:hypothetical protein PG984_014593 [Apiospora sp. TS-2023a]
MLSHSRMSQWPVGLMLAGCLPIALGQVRFVGTNSSHVNAPFFAPYPDTRLSLACLSTLSTKLPCDGSLLDIAFESAFPEPEDLLEELCDPGCLRSLESLRDAQRDACADDVMFDEGEWFPVTYTVDALLWAYDWSCKRDPPTGEFCAPIFDKWTWTKDHTAPAACTDCVLGTYQRRLGNALGYFEDLASSFAALISSCHATAGYAVTVPPPNTIDAATAAAAMARQEAVAKSCASMYTVQEGDDCHSISIAQRVSTNALLYLNDLEAAGCAHFAPAGTRLCMPPSCDVYTVQPNDTSCWAIRVAHRYNFNIMELLSWNVDISNDCDNLEELTGHQICVSWPGGITPEEEEDAMTVSASAAIASAEIGGGSSNDNDYKYKNPCVGLLTVPGPSSCYATTYPPAPPIDFTMPPRVGEGTTEEAVSATPTWTNYDDVKPGVLPPYRYKPSVNPTPTPYSEEMVQGCTRFSRVQRKFCFPFYSSESRVATG